ncbi:MAG: hypothetical protein P1V51_04635 [Deltaproteobacteria bacterium]|nr:hypothetical protein [Deltaproteobacteria bacterium]
MSPTIELLRKLALPLLAVLLVPLAFACLQPADLYRCDLVEGETDPCLAGEICSPEGICVAIADGGDPGDGGTDGGGTDGGGSDGGQPPCNGSCSGATPYCDTILDQCVGCLEEAHCNTTLPYCDADGTCVECLGNLNCSDPLLPACDPGQRICVGCIEGNDCHGDTPYCDTARQLCVGCRDAVDCNGNVAGSVCNPLDSTCVECTAASHCSADPARPVCDTVSFACVQCVVSGDCDGTTGDWCDQGTCAWSTDGGLDGGLDAGSDGGGVCLTDTDCITDPNGPTCVSGTCIYCVTDGDCQGHPNGGVCDTGSGTCWDGGADGGLDAGTDGGLGDAGLTCTIDDDCWQVDPTVPVCNNGTCSECKGGDISTCINGALFCTDGRCIQCLQQSDCTDQTLNVCSNGLCVDCVSSSDCLGAPCVDNVCQSA